MHNAQVLLVIDLIGVFVFALAGATAAPALTCLACWC
jgi:hypothetical protein